MPWLLIGLVCATFIERFLPIEWLPGLPRPLAVAGAAIVGAFVSLPAVALIPIATPLLQKGLSQGAAIALLVTGPTVTRFSYGWLSDRYGKAPALAFAAAITTGAVAVGLEADAILDSPRAPDLISGSVSLWRLACSLALGLLAVRTLLRLGPGGMVAQLGTHRREHDHEVH